MSGAAWQVTAGSRVRVVDLEDGQTGDVFAVAADDLEDGLSNGRTFDYGESIRLSTGSVLSSRRSRPLLTSCPAAKASGGRTLPIGVEIVPTA